MKIAHFSLDEKFINSAISQFEELKVSNTFYIYAPGIKSSKHLRYVNPNPAVVVLSLKWWEFFKTIIGIDSDFYIFHGMTFHSAIVHSLARKRNKKTIWLLWGAEFYSNQAIFPDQHRFIDQIEGFPEPKVKDVDLINRAKHRFVKSQLKKVNVLGVPFEQQAETVEKKINAQYDRLFFMYYPLETSLQEFSLNRGEDILLGNSASSTNNHIQAIDKLSSLEIYNRKVITPLSYGDRRYADIVNSYGNLNLPNNFQALLDFMPLDKYQGMIKNCGVAILNHRRQQAFGTTIYLLIGGTKIFLNPDNIVYPFLKSIGVKVYSTGELSQGMLSNLEEKDQINNRNLLIQRFGKAVLRKKLRTFFENSINES